MKLITNKNLLLILLLILSSFAMGMSTAWAADYNGSLEDMEGNLISGWACSTSSPDTSAHVQILVKNHDTRETIQEFTVFASEKRTDISSEEKLNDYCGFSAELDWSSQPEGTYDIEAYVDGKKLPNTLQYQKKADGDMITKLFDNPALQAIGPYQLKSLGTFRLTGYCKCRICCGKWSSINSTYIGSIPRVNHTIAVDPSVIPFGSKVMVNGIVYTAEDKGSGVRGKHIDIFCGSHQEALCVGGKQEVFLLQ
ncbi:3D domain-containing protein [Lachnospiraceae bacterium 62-35]